MDYEWLHKNKRKKVTITMTLNQAHTLQCCLAWDACRACMELEEEPGSINTRYPYLLENIAKLIEKQTGVENQVTDEIESVRGSR